MKCYLLTKWAEVQQFESFTKMTMATTTDPVAIQVVEWCYEICEYDRRRKFLFQWAIFVTEYRQSFHIPVFFSTILVSAGFRPLYGPHKLCIVRYLLRWTCVLYKYYIDVGDRCWRRNILVTIFKYRLPNVSKMINLTVFIHTQALFNSLTVTFRFCF